MPGSPAQQFANLRLLSAHMWTRPGKKLLFMGSELAPWWEWNEERGPEWNLLDEPFHRGVCRVVTALGALYRERPCRLPGAYSGGTITTPAGSSGSTVSTVRTPSSPTCAGMGTTISSSC